MHNKNTNTNKVINLPSDPSKKNIPQSSTMISGSYIGDLEFSKDKIIVEEAHDNPYFQTSNINFNFQQIPSHYYSPISPNLEDQSPGSKEGRTQEYIELNEYESEIEMSSVVTSSKDTFFMELQSIDHHNNSKSKGQKNLNGNSSSNNKQKSTNNNNIVSMESKKDDKNIKPENIKPKVYNISESEIHEEHLTPTPARNKRDNNNNNIIYGNNPNR